MPRGRTGLVTVAALVVILLICLPGAARLYTTYLWFGEVRLISVWRGVLGAKLVLAGVFISLFFVALRVNLAVADRLAPDSPPAEPEDAFLQRYQGVVGAHRGAVHTAVAALLAVLVGAPAAGQWNNWIPFRNPVSFGLSDPQFHKDVSFYVFTLPFLSFLVDWLFVAIVVIAVVTVMAHYLNGGVRFRASGRLVTSPVKAHTSVLLGCLALTKAVGYFLARYELNFSTRGVVSGATYTDVKAQLPALTLLILISLLAVALFLYNIRLQGWVLPGLAVGLWAFTSVVVGGLYPALIQRFKVDPAENKRERPYIVRNIEATRTALDLARVEETPFDYSENLTAADLQDNAATIRNVRLWDPLFVKATYQKLQEIRSYYRFNEVAIDRYEIDGKLTQMIVSARELNAADLPSESWVNRHLQFTHGYGALLAPANAVTQDGKPDFLIRDIPPVATGVPALTQPRIYYGRAAGGYAIVRSGQKEIDFQRPDGTSQESTYAGRGGVPVDSLLRRIAIALRFRDPNALISNYITGDSRALYLRDIGSRVRTAAPFLRYDADPYPGRRGGPRGLDPRRLHHDLPVPLCAALRRAAPGGQRAARPAQLRPQLSQGGHRRLRPHDDLLPGRSTRPDRPCLRQGLSGAVHPGVEDKS
jgi:hypothetical protein